MKASNFILTLLIGLLIGWPVSTLYADEPEPDIAPIYLRSRTILPDPAASAAELQGSGSSFGPNNSSDEYQGLWHGLIQITGVPDAATRQRLSDAGVTLLAYIPDNTWLARLPGDPTAVETLPEVVWIGTLAAQDKLDPLLWEAPAELKNPDGTITVQVQLFADVNWAEVPPLLTQYGGIIQAESPDVHQFTATFSPGALRQLAGADTVQWIMPRNPEKETLNADVRAAMRADIVHTAPYGLNGRGIQAAIWDQGVVDAAHPDFTDRLTIVNGNAPQWHATHVAGTMAGDGRESQNQGFDPHALRGIAWGSDILSFDWQNIMPYVNQAINTYGADLLQNSWGYAQCSYFGLYFGQSADYDRVSRGYYGRAVPVIFAVGNSYGQCNTTYGTVLGGAQTAKNVLTAGALDKNGRVATYSSWGPTRDGRLKPEIVAVGSSVASTCLDGTYCGASGTSMAAPAVSGGVAVLLQHYNDVCPLNNANGGAPLPATLRALVTHTAVDLNDPALTHLNPGPDFASGYGALNLEAAVQALPFHLEASLAAGEVHTYTLSVAHGQPELKVTLAWDDPPAAYNPAVVLINNLDLELVAPDGTSVHGPWLLDGMAGNEALPAARPVWTQGEPPQRDDRNVIEQVVVDSPAAGTWTIRVLGSNIPSGPQTYSLVNDLLTTTSCRSAPADVNIGTEQGATWRSDGIWVRHDADGLKTHQPPLAGHDNTIYVRLAGGDAPLAHGQIFVYWADAQLDLAWPQAWHVAGRTHVLNLAAGEERLVQLPWQLPTEWDPSREIALYARLVAPQSMALNETAASLANAQAHPNIALRNVVTTHQTSPWEASWTVKLTNPTSAAVSADFTFDFSDNLLTAQSALSIDMPWDLYQGWLENGAQGSGIALEDSYEGVVVVDPANLSLLDVPLPAGVARELVVRAHALPAGTLSLDVAQSFDGAPNGRIGLDVQVVEQTSSAQPTQITGSGGEVVLSWTRDAAHAAYEVWRSRDAAFVPGTPSATLIGNLDAAAYQPGATLQFVDDSLPAGTMFYRVRARASTGALKAESPLLAGVNLSLEDGKSHLIRLPFVDDEMNTAAALKAYVEAHSTPALTVTAVQRWDAASQSYQLYTHTPLALPDFEIEPLTPYYIEVAIAPAETAVWTLAGEVPPSTPSSALAAAHTGTRGLYYGQIPNHPEQVNYLVWQAGDNAPPQEILTEDSFNAASGPDGGYQNGYWLFNRQNFTAGAAADKRVHFVFGGLGTAAGQTWHYTLAEPNSLASEDVALSAQSGSCPTIQSVISDGTQMTLTWTGNYGQYHVYRSLEAATQASGDTPHPYAARAGVTSNGRYQYLATVSAAGNTADYTDPSGGYGWYVVVPAHASGEIAGCHSEEAGARVPTAVTLTAFETGSRGRSTHTLALGATLLFLTLLIWRSTLGTQPWMRIRPVRVRK